LARYLEFLLREIEVSALYSGQCGCALSISPELRGCVTAHFLTLPKLQLVVKKHRSYANNRFNGLS